jgi:site-specific recombinase XerC
MTRHVRSLGGKSEKTPSWRNLRSPPAANDLTDTTVSLGRALPKDPAELSALRDALELERPTELRAAALLAVLGLGLRKREIVELDCADIVRLGAVICVAVKSRARRDQGRDSFLPVIGEDARSLKAYLASRGERPPRGTPLFCSVERGPERRITVNSINYWLMELRLRARRTSRASEP